MSLPEDLRQQYLEILGIVSYFPRFILPAAPPPQPCKWPEAWKQHPPQSREADNRQAPEEKPAATDVPAPISRGAGDLSGSQPASGQTPEAVQPPISHKPTGRAKTEVDTSRKAPAQRKPALEETRLQLLCIRVNESLAILNAMPHFGPGQLSRQHMALLQNMLRVSGVDPQALMIDEKPFHWPMVQGEHVDNSKSAAAAALTAFLQQKEVDWQFNNLLVMGEQVVRRLFISPAEGDEGGSGGNGAQNNGQSISTNPDRPAMESQSWQTFYSRSLDEILQTPKLKKESWHIIRKIRF